MSNCVIKEKSQRKSVAKPRVARNKLSMNRLGAPTSLPAIRPTEEHAGRDAGAPRSRGSWSQCEIRKSSTLSMNLRTRFRVMEPCRGGPFIARKDHQIFFLFFGGAIETIPNATITLDATTDNAASIQVRADEKQKEGSIQEQRRSINGPSLRGLTVLLPKKCH